MAIRRPELVRGLVIVDGGGFQAPALQVRALLRPDGAAPLPARDLPRLQRAATCAHRREADRRARDASIATTREDPGLQAVAELWRSFVSPEHDLRAQAAAIVGADDDRLGSAGPRDTAVASAAASNA